MKSLRSMMLCCAAILAACSPAGDTKTASTETKANANAAPVILALRETPAVGTPMDEDAADDPAIWVDPVDPTQSRIIGTDKKGGLYVYDLQAKELQFVQAGLVNNVDLRDGFQFADGVAPIVVASDRDDQTIAVFRFDPATRQLSPQLAAIPSTFPEVYGICLFRTQAGAMQVVATSALGPVKQWELTASANGIAAKEVRSFDLGSIAEGCVADDATGSLFIAEENVGIWRLAADPSLGDMRVLIDKAGEGGHLTADVEGLAIYDGPNRGGYLIASSQGSDEFAVYERTEDNAYIGSFKIGAGNGIDAVTGTDGLEVTSVSMGPDYPGGLVVVQDDENTEPNEPQNFKLIPWSTVESAITEMRAK
jgi:3-phytase